MWPEKLLELLPHVRHLAPLADYLANRGAADKAQESALGSLKEEFNSRAAALAEAQSGLQRTLLDHSEKVDALGVEVSRTRIAVENAEARIAKLEKNASLTRNLLIAVLVLSASALVLLFVLFLHHS